MNASNSGARVCIRCLSKMTRFLLLVAVLLWLIPWIARNPLHAQDAGRWQSLTVTSEVSRVQPMTGIALWSSNPSVASAPIQLEFAYMRYDEVVRGPEQYDWAPLDKLLDEVASRGHQLILRWHDTYVGQSNGLPAYLQRLPGYQGVVAKSEGKSTGFPDWSRAEVQKFATDFFTQFAQRYDRDPRLAFLQVGFGLWSEYHIYDGPYELGRTFPSKEYQASFARHLATVFRDTRWMISVDAADSQRAPFADNSELLGLPFGLFDDSFNHARHARVNEPNWKTLGLDRWQRAPAGGEFSFYEKVDQKAALSASGPHGISFEKQAAKFHISFIIGDNQPKYQSQERLREASQSCGYRFRLLKLVTDGSSTRATVTNAGVAPIYYDAFPSMKGVRATASLKHLLPGETKEFLIPSTGKGDDFSIECDRLVQGQRIDVAN